MVALVTGATSRVGSATVRRLAREPGARLVLVARHEDRLRALAHEIAGATVVAVDLTDDDAPARVAEAVEREHGQLDLLVNNAGTVRFGQFAKGGFEDVRGHMAINFDAPVRLIEALLPLLRRSAPSAIVNVVSLAARIGRRHLGAYAASKSALAGWSEVLHVEERPHRVHVGLVVLGASSKEIFHHHELERGERLLKAQLEHAAEAILAAGPGGRAERYVPRRHWLPAAMRLLTPGLLRWRMGRRLPRGRDPHLASRLLARARSLLD